MFQDLNPLDRSTAIMEIIILMLVAAIIGFVVAWLYYRSIYRKKIAVLEEEFADYRATHVPKADLEASQAALAAMTDDRNRLRVDLNNSQTKLQTSESEVARLRVDLATATTALSKSTAEIVELKGQITHLEARLKDCEIQLKEVTASRNALIEELAAARKQAAELEVALAICEKKDGQDGPLITPAPEAKKKATKRLKAKPVAKKLPAASKEDKLAAIRDKRGSINFDRIGVATFEERDDLKLIKGIGPFIEEKLNALGIFTFAQIGRFVDEDAEAITKAIAFFPGRIQRDNWVAQAREM